MRLFRTKRMAVLGCGPAGLFAAHALASKGRAVTIYSKRRKSEMFGAQYLHAPIPGLTETGPVQIHYRLEGTVEEYRQKVYSNPFVRVSPEDLLGEHPAWDIREAYDNAWTRYFDLIQDVPEIGPDWIQEVLLPQRYDMIVSTIPLPAICKQPDEHIFNSQAVWAIGDAPERGVFSPVRTAPPFTVNLNGSRHNGWYRNANIFGRITTEWPEGRKPPLGGVARVVKPISTDCDCYADQIYKAGRYGAWVKGYLAHHAYEQAGLL